MTPATRPMKKLARLNFMALLGCDKKQKGDHLARESETAAIRLGGNMSAAYAARLRSSPEARATGIFTVTWR